MQATNILLHVIGLIAFLTRLNNIRKAIKRNENDKIKFEILIIILIVVIWAFLVWGLPYLFKERN